MNRLNFKNGINIVVFLSGVFVANVWAQSRFQIEETNAKRKTLMHFPAGLYFQEGKDYFDRGQFVPQDVLKAFEKRFPELSKLSGRVALNRIEFDEKGRIFVIFSAEHIRDAAPIEIAEEEDLYRRKTASVSFDSIGEYRNFLKREWRPAYLVVPTTKLTFSPLNLKASELGQALSVSDRLSQEDKIVFDAADKISIFRIDFSPDIDGPVRVQLEAMNRQYDAADDVITWDGNRIELRFKTRTEFEDAVAKIDNEFVRASILPWSLGKADVDRALKRGFCEEGFAGFLN